jgi:hypothetical protein
MTGGAQDLEKQAAAAHTKTDDHAVSSSSLKKDLATGQETHRRLTTSSTDTDPLSPLQHALARPLSSADIEQLPPLDNDDDDEDADDNNNTANPIHLTRTLTSIASAASRPPDYEVTLDADDPENPKNW